MHAFLLSLEWNLKKKGWGGSKKANLPLHLQGFLGHHNPRSKLFVHYKQLLSLCWLSLSKKKVDVEVCLPKMGATNKRCEMDKRERGRAGFIYNGWLAENETWLFFISPVVVKEVPVTMRAMLPGQWMFPWQLGNFYPLFWLMLSCCLG